MLYNFNQVLGVQVWFNTIAGDLKAMKRCITDVSMMQHAANNDLLEKNTKRKIDTGALGVAAPLLPQLSSPSNIPSFSPKLMVIIQKSNTPGKGAYHLHQLTTSIQTQDRTAHLGEAAGGRERKGPECAREVKTPSALSHYVPSPQSRELRTLNPNTLRIALLPVQ